MDSSVYSTILAIGVCAILGSLSYYRHTKPHDKLTPRMVPWIVIALGCLATGFMLIVHLVNLLGFETGRR